MPEWTIAAVTGHHTLGALFGRNLGDQIDSPVLVDQSSRVGETQIAIVVLLKHLEGSIRNPLVLKSQTKTNSPSLFRATFIWVHCSIIRSSLTAIFCITAATNVVVYKYLSGVCNCGQFVAFGGPLRGTAAQLADLADASGEALADFAAGHFENVGLVHQNECTAAANTKIKSYIFIWLVEWTESVSSQLSNGWTTWIFAGEYSLDHTEEYWLIIHSTIFSVS